MVEILVVNENGVHFAPAEDSTVHVMLDFPLNMDYIVSEGLGDNMDPLDDMTDYTVSVAALVEVFSAAEALTASGNRFNADPGLIQAVEDAVRRAKGR